MLTGRGARVAIVDSGVNAAHPHIPRIAGGIAIDQHGRTHHEGLDYIDRLGHGTAVAAAIAERAPDADLFAVKVFDRALATSADSIVAAIGWAAEQGMHLINLSLGTSKAQHAAAFEAAVASAAARGSLIVSAFDDGSADGVRWLPGTLPGVISVQVDWTLPRDRYEVVHADGVRLFRASGFAREIPGIPPERNLHGPSFAVANMTGFAACALEGVLGESIEPTTRFARLLDSLRNL